MSGAVIPCLEWFYYFLLPCIILFADTILFLLCHKASGLETFPGLVVHSHDYRHAELFQGSMWLFFVLDLLEKTFVFKQQSVQKWFTSAIM